MNNYCKLSRNTHLTVNGKNEINVYKSGSMQSSWKCSVTIHLKLSIIYGLSIPKAPNIYLTTKLQCKPRKVYRTAYFPGRPGQAW